MRSDTSNLLIGMLAGAAIGAATTMLLTPISGPDARRRIKSSANAAKGRAVDISTKAKQKATDVSQKAKDTVASMRSQACERAEEVTSSEARQGV